MKLYICSNTNDFNGKFIIVHSRVEFTKRMNYLYTEYNYASKQNISKLLN